MSIFGFTEDQRCAMARALKEVIWESPRTGARLAERHLTVPQRISARLGLRSAAETTKMVDDFRRAALNASYHPLRAHSNATRTTPMAATEVKRLSTSIAGIIPYGNSTVDGRKIRFQMGAFYQSLNRNDNVIARLNHSFDGGEEIGDRANGTLRFSTDVMSANLYFEIHLPDTIQSRHLIESFERITGVSCEWSDEQKVNGHDGYTYVITARLLEINLLHGSSSPAFGRHQRLWLQEGTRLR